MNLLRGCFRGCVARGSLACHVLGAGAVLCPRRVCVCVCVCVSMSVCVCVYVCAGVS